MTARRPVVLVLTGPSSAGKTSLAKEIQRLSEISFALLEADRVFPSMPPEVHRAIVRRHGLDAVVVALHRSIAAWASAGLDLVVDGSLPYGNPQLRARCLSTLGQFDLRVVTVRCDATVLGRREHGRPDRPSGWAAQQATDIHDGLVGDAHVDTSEASSADCAESVLRQLDLAASPSSG